MQREGTPGAARGGSGASAPAGGLVASIVSSRKFVIGISAVVCLVLVCAFLYTPAQQYYHAVRAYDQATAELAAVQERNEELSASVESLSTDAGIEALARDDLGWVSEGEALVHVQGLGDTESDEDGTSSTTGNIQPGSIEAPETWYSPILDLIFGEG